jgi:hypothetical protein
MAQRLGFLMRSVDPEVAGRALVEYDTLIQDTVLGILREPGCIGLTDDDDKYARRVIQRSTRNGGCGFAKVACIARAAFTASVLQCSPLLRHVLPHFLAGEGETTAETVSATTQRYPFLAPALSEASWGAWHITAELVREATPRADATGERSAAQTAQGSESNETDQTAQPGADAEAALLAALLSRPIHEVVDDALSNRLPRTMQRRLTAVLTAAADKETLEQMIVEARAFSKTKAETNWALNKGHNAFTRLLHLYQCSDDGHEWVDDPGWRTDQWGLPRAGSVDTHTWDDGPLAPLPFRLAMRIRAGLPISTVWHKAHGMSDMQQADANKGESTPAPRANLPRCHCSNGCIAKRLPIDAHALHLLVSVHAWLTPRHHAARDHLARLLRTAGMHAVPEGYPFRGVQGATPSEADMHLDVVTSMPRATCAKLHPGTLRGGTSGRDGQRDVKVLYDVTFSHPCAHLGLDKEALLLDREAISKGQARLKFNHYGAAVQKGAGATEAMALVPLTFSALGRQDPATAHALRAITRMAANCRTPSLRKADEAAELELFGHPSHPLDRPFEPPFVRNQLRMLSTTVQRFLVLGMLHAVEYCAVPPFAPPPASRAAATARP